VCPCHNFRRSKASSLPLFFFHRAFCPLGSNISLFPVSSFCEFFVTPLLHPPCLLPSTRAFRCFSALTHADTQPPYIPIFYQQRCRSLSPEPPWSHPQRQPTALLVNVFVVPCLLSLHPVVWTPPPRAPVKAFGFAFSEPAFIL